VDYLSAVPTVYSIGTVPAQPWVTRYTDGGGVKQFVFVFRSLEVYGGGDIMQNIENIAFFERLSEWFRGNRPSIKNWNWVEALTNGYVFDVAEGQDRASYQIQCRAVYTV
jgi:hypothetical protein